MSGLIHKLKERSGKELERIGESPETKKKKKKSLLDKLLAYSMRNDSLYKEKGKKK